jgi:hypothetical protein
MVWLIIATRHVLGPNSTRLHEVKYVDALTLSANHVKSEVCTAISSVEAQFDGR